MPHNGKLPTGVGRLNLPISNRVRFRINEGAVPAETWYFTLAVFDHAF